MKNNQENKEYPMQRNLDGVYYRQKRGDKYTDVCFTDMTHEEQIEVLKSYNVRQLTRMAYLMANVVKNIDEQLELKEEDWEKVFDECDIDADQMKDIVWLFSDMIRTLGDTLSIEMRSEEENGM